jgi:hypothetical protein
LKIFSSFNYTRARVNDRFFIFVEATLTIIRAIGFDAIVYLMINEILSFVSHSALRMASSGEELRF